MVTNKHITKIIIVVMAAAVVLCFLLSAFSGGLSKQLGGAGIKMEYESKLFNTGEIINIDIQMDKAGWDEMLSNAMSEEYFSCDVVINGEKISNVAIRPKGNTSLMAIAADPDSDRYSFKLEFDHFVDGQTCFGLDKLILNNNYADATNMKEAVIYDMYQYLDVDASLYNYAKISLNGEYWGIYLALEGVEESFMLRNFGTQDGEMYKPEGMGMGSAKPSPNGRDKKNGTSSKENGRPEFGGFSPDDMPGNGDFSPDDMPGNKDFSPKNKGDFSMGGSGGANLNYTDDNLDSYSTIWEGEITKTGKKDHRKVVAALKNISEGTSLEKYLDIDNVLKYMAVHTFAVNMDSLSGSMAHNYYLYEYDGQLNIIPWDYNLSFGGMSMESSNTASTMVNYAVDTPFSGTKFFDALLKNEEYLEKYHNYLRQLVNNYVNGGEFEKVYSRIKSQIDSLVETDPTAFYNYNDYLTATKMLYQTIMLRAESINGQLDGTIPSTDNGQRQDSSSLVDASEIDTNAMGQFNMGGFGGGPGDKSRKPESAGNTEKDNTAPSSSEKAEGNSSPQQPPFSGIPDQRTNQVKTKNLITYGIYLAVMFMVLVSVKYFKRRK